MHEQFAQVLNQRDLSRAGDLFTVEDKDIVDDLSEVIQKIEEISSTKDFLNSDNDQSVVEICITRVTSAIRETESISKHVSALVNLLESCLDQNLTPSTRDEDPPHAKIASDILRCLFLNYHARAEIMKVALPVAVKFLPKDNKEICRSLTSYLSLVVIDNASLLAEQIPRILDSIILGNPGLVRVLPQIYEENKDLIKKKIPELMNVMPSCESAELANLLQLFVTIAKSNPELIEPHIPSLLENTSTTSATQLVQILTILAEKDVNSFILHTTKLKEIGDSYPSTLPPIVKILGTLGECDKDLAKEVLEYMVSKLGNDDVCSIQPILEQIQLISTAHPGLLAPHIDTICQHEEVSSSAALIILELKQMEAVNSGQTDEKEMISTASQTEGELKISELHKSTEKSQDSKGSTVNLSNDTKQDSVPLATPETSGTESPTKDVGTSAEPSTPVSTGSGANTVQNNNYTEPKRDTGQHFCDKHLGKIKAYITDVSRTVPIPTKCTVEESKSKRRMVLSYSCNGCSPHCLYSGNYFLHRTKLPKTWAHLMFLSEQAQSAHALSQDDPAIAMIKHVWERLKTEATSGVFTRLVTSSFPSQKDQEAVVHELQSIRFFDVFEYSVSQKQWVCFLCNNPDKVSGLLQDGHPVIEGQLKEKKGRWKFFKRWKTRYFTLSGANITYSRGDQKKATLPVNKIQSVKAVKKGARQIPKAFEIFTNDQTKFVLKAKDGKNAEQWVQCLHIAVAHSQKQDDGIIDLAETVSQTPSDPQTKL
ncbi:ventricular zone-expressed PH domain-containing protein homolog 1-like [Lineus longissimus]|uniref:ventricular zone-expressed PH domain-containing protein homolog 1-like n=1 Tax=Lineus longissimus TaxID=88925 RepID=UPI002B4D7356